jgi:hypothetical protein
LLIVLLSLQSADCTLLSIGSFSLHPFDPVFQKKNYVNTTHDFDFGCLCFLETLAMFVSVATGRALLKIAMERSRDLVTSWISGVKFNSLRFVFRR